MRLCYLAALVPLGVLALPSPRPLQASDDAHPLPPRDSLEKRALLEVPASPFSQVQGASSGTLVHALRKAEGTGGEPTPQNPYARPESHSAGTSAPPSPFEGLRNPFAYDKLESAPIRVSPSISGEKRKPHPRQESASVPIDIPGTKKFGSDDAHRQNVENVRRIVHAKKAAGILRRKPRTAGPAGPATGPIPIAAPRSQQNADGNTIVGSPPRQQEWPLLYQGLSQDKAAPHALASYVPPPHGGVYVRKRDVPALRRRALERSSNAASHGDEDGAFDGLAPPPKEDAKKARAQALETAEADGADQADTAEGHAHVQKRASDDEPAETQLAERLKQRTAAWERRAYRSEVEYRATRNDIDALHARAARAALPTPERIAAYRSVGPRIQQLQDRLSRDRARWEAALDRERSNGREDHPVLGAEVRRAVWTSETLVRACGRRVAELEAMKTEARLGGEPSGRDEELRRRDASGKHLETALHSRADNVAPHSTADTGLRKREIIPDAPRGTCQIIPRVEQPVRLRGLQKSSGDAPPKQHPHVQLKKPPKERDAARLGLQRLILERLTAEWVREAAAKKEESHAAWVQIVSLKGKAAHQARLKMPERTQYETQTVLHKKVAQLHSRMNLELRKELQRRTIVLGRMQLYPGLKGDGERANEVIMKRLTDGRKIQLALEHLKDQEMKPGPRLETIPEERLHRRKVLAQHPQKTLSRRTHDEEGPKEIEMKDMKPPSLRKLSFDSHEAAAREQEHSHSTHDHGVRVDPDLKKYPEGTPWNFRFSQDHDFASKALTSPPKGASTASGRNVDAKVKNEREEASRRRGSGQLDKTEKQAIQEPVEPGERVKHGVARERAKEAEEDVSPNKVSPSHRPKKLYHPLEDVEVPREPSPRILRRDRLLPREVPLTTLRDSYISDVGSSASHWQAEKEKLDARLREAQEIAKHERLGMRREAELRTQKIMNGRRTLGWPGYAPAKYLNIGYSGRNRKGAGELRRIDEESAKEKAESLKPTAMSERPRHSLAAASNGDEPAVQQVRVQRKKFETQQTAREKQEPEQGQSMREINGGAISQEGKQESKAPKEEPKRAQPLTKISGHEGKHSNLDEYNEKKPAGVDPQQHFPQPSIEQSAPAALRKRAAVPTTLHKRQSWPGWEAKLAKKMEEPEETNPQWEKALEEFHHFDRPDHPGLHRDHRKYRHRLILKAIRMKLGMEDMQEKEAAGARRLEREESTDAKRTPKKTVFTDSRLQPHEIRLSDSKRQREGVNHRMRAAKDSVSSINQYYEREGAEGKPKAHPTGQHDSLDQHASSMIHRRSAQGADVVTSSPRNKESNLSSRLHLFPQYTSKPLEDEAAKEQGLAKVGQIDVSRCFTEN